MSISLLRRLLMKEAVKDTAGSSGIMSINKNIAAKVEQQVQRYVNDAMRQGVDLDTLSPEQLKMIVQMNKPKPPRVIAADSPEGRGITEALLGKQKAPVFDMEGNIIPEGSGIMGGKQIQPINMTVKERTGGMLKGKYESDKAVKELMDSGQVSKGARGMKKSKKVQDREMFQDANKRLTSDVDSIIKNIQSMEPITAMKEANSVIARKGKYKNLTQEQSKKILQDTEDHIFERYPIEDPEDFATGGRAEFKGGGLTESDYLKVKDMLNHYFDYRKSGGTLSKTKFANAFFRENNADGGVAGLLGERPGYSIGNKVENINPYMGLNNITQDEEDEYADIEGQTAGLLNNPFTRALGMTLISGGTMSATAIAEMMARQKLMKEAIFKPGAKILSRKLKTSGSIKDTGVGSTTTNSGGGSGDVGGNKNVGGGNTAKNSKGQTAAQATSAGTGTSQGYSQHFADGGPARQNFAMGKRAFLKMLAGAGAGIAGLKTGLFGIGGKEATKKAVTETVKSAGSTPPPYFFKLAEKIKKLGSDTTPTNDRTIAKSLKSKDGKSDYILEEDVSSGDTIIKKVNKEGDEMITDVQIMELRKGEVVKGKDGKARKTPDEYEEVTEANARIEGDVFNDPYYSDGIEIDDILREVDDIPVPKASGGIARMLGE